MKMNKIVNSSIFWIFIIVIFANPVLCEDIQSHDGNFNNEHFRQNEFNEPLEIDRREVTEREHEHEVNESDKKLETENDDNEEQDQNEETKTDSESANEMEKSESINQDQINVQPSNDNLHKEFISQLINSYEKDESIEKGETLPQPQELIGSQNLEINQGHVLSQPSVLPNTHLFLANSQKEKFLNTQNRAKNILPNNNSQNKPKHEYQDLGKHVKNHFSQILAKQNSNKYITEHLNNQNQQNGYEVNKNVHNQFFVNQNQEDSNSQASFLSNQNSQNQQILQAQNLQGLFLANQISPQLLLPNQNQGLYTVPQQQNPYFSSLFINPYQYLNPFQQNFPYLTYPQILPPVQQTTVEQKIYKPISFEEKIHKPIKTEEKFKIKKSEIDEKYDAVQDTPYYTIYRVKDPSQIPKTKTHIHKAKETIQKNENFDSLKAQLLHTFTQTQIPDYLKNVKSRPIIPLSQRGQIFPSHKNEPLFKADDHIISSSTHNLRKFQNIPISLNGKNNFANKFQTEANYASNGNFKGDEVAFAAMQAKNIGGPSFIDPGYFMPSLSYELNGKKLEKFQSTNEAMGQIQNFYPKQIGSFSQKVETKKEPVLWENSNKNLGKSSKGEKNLQIKDIEVGKKPLVPPSVLSKLLKATTGDDFEFESYYK